MKVRVGDVVKKDAVLLIVESPELGRAQSEFLQKRTEADIAQAGAAPRGRSLCAGKKAFR